jgi:hypothetical protein
MKRYSEEREQGRICQREGRKKISKIKQQRGRFGEKQRAREMDAYVERKSEREGDIKRDSCTCKRSRIVAHHKCVCVCVWRERERERERER